MQKRGNWTLRVAWAVCLVTALLFALLEAAMDLGDLGGYPGMYAIAAAWVTALPTSRLQPRGMAWGMAAVAGVKAVLCALVVPSFGDTIIRPAAFFCVLWLWAAGLFYRAAVQAAAASQKSILRE